MSKQHPLLLPHLFNEFGVSFRIQLFPIRVIQPEFFVHFNFLIFSGQFILGEIEFYKFYH